jgi:tetratricopeptide (TPR) repeat protein
VVAPLIGRDDELTVLRQSVATAIRRSRPLVTFLLGEAGMGKSRLIEEVAGWAVAEHGALLLEGRCVPYGEANPWWPIAEAVRRACGVEPGDTAAGTSAKVRSTVARVCEVEDDDPEAAQLAAGLLHLMGDEDALPDVDPQRARLETRRSLYALMAGLTRISPVVLVLSELHWADEVVLDLFGWHIDRLAGHPLVVLASSRFELMDRWSPPYGRFNLLTLHLDPLDPASTRELAEALGAAALPAEVTDALVQRSGGNPFFLEELLTFVGEASGGAVARPAGGGLPVTLRGLVAARIDALLPDERSVLEDAAVIGRSSTMSILRALSGSRGVEDVDGVVGRLLERDLLGLNDDKRWEFRSEVVREVVYGVLTKSERARRHWVVATWLTDAGKRTGRTDEMIEWVAHHFATTAELILEIGPVPPVSADVVDVAILALGKAAGWASRRELPAPAVRLLDRAVALAPEGSAARCRLLLDRALERATLRDVELARLDLDAARPGDDPVLQARELTVAGVIQQMEGDLAGSAETLRRAVDAWRRAGDRAGEGDALRRFGLSCMLSADTEGAEAALDGALAIARELGSRREEAWALWHLAELSFYSGRVDEAEARLQAAGHAFAEAGDSGGLGWVKGLLGYLRLVQGAREEAERLALSILGDLRDRGDRWALGMVLVLLASVRMWQGESAAAAEGALEARGCFAEINDLPGELRATGLLVRALAAGGRAAEAWEVLRELLTGRDAVSLAAPELGVAGLAIHLGDGGTALAVLDETVAVVFVDEAAITRGMALLHTGRPEEALSGLETMDLDAGPSGVAANGWASRALARACAADAAGALDAADRVLAMGSAATYRDVVLARLARAFARHRKGESGAWLEEIDHARRVSGVTDDVVTSTVVELAAGRLGQAAGSGGGEEAAGAALARLATMGASAQGWDALVMAAVGDVAVGEGAAAGG